MNLVVRLFSRPFDRFPTQVHAFYGAPELVAEKLWSELAKHDVACVEFDPSGSEEEKQAFRSAYARLWG